MMGSGDGQICLLAKTLHDGVLILVPMRGQRGREEGGKRRGEGGEEAVGRRNLSSLSA